MKPLSIGFIIRKYEEDENMQKSKTPRGMSQFKTLLLSFTLLLVLAGCKDSDSSSPEKNSDSETQASYQITEENGNPEITMQNQPISSFWFPEELLQWKADEDPDLPYNISNIPLAERVDKEKLTAVNEAQNKDTEVVALSIMNSSTSGNAPHGLNKFDSNTFSYWQYIDKMVYWGGSSGEGLIVPPSPDVTNAAHKNGVPILGTVFFPPMAYNGKMEWLDDFLHQDKEGHFPMVDKLIEVADLYQFDGWFINQEIEGNEEQPLTKEHATRMSEFIKQFKEQSEDKFEIMYYDSMTSEGIMDWQNALNDENALFLIDEDGGKLADSMFLNFWWTEDRLADKELLKASNQKAIEIGFDPYKVYAGVDVQANGFTTPIRWDLFEKSANATYTSLGLYAADWPYSSSDSLEDFQMRENLFWVNSKGDPTVVDEATGTEWRGISRYAIEKSALATLPFTTNFNVGNGYNFFIDGEKVSEMDWNNRGVSDILPTYRWIMEHEGMNNLTPSLDFAQAYYGGNSLKFRGKMEENKASTVKLYSADLPLTKDITFTTTAKANTDTQLDLVLDFSDGSTEIVKADKKLEENWTTVNYDLSKFSDKVISTISYQFSTNKTTDGFDMHLGNISILDRTSIDTSNVTDVVVEDNAFDEESMLAGVRLTWNVDKPENHYEIYRVNDDKTRSLLGVSNTTNFYINTLPRVGETNTSTFEVVPVNSLLARGTSSSASMEWPDISLPKSNFTASRTLIAPGDTVLFKNLSSQNTKELAWSFPGADQESSTENEPTVTYSKEGTYKVSLLAKSDTGEDEKTIDSYIVVSAKAKGDLALLSQGKPTEASSFVNDNEGPSFAVDGTTDSKWCAIGTPPHELTIDLESVKTISELSIAHAEAGNEGSDMNTKAYTISVSEDGITFTDVVNITKNSLGNTTDTFAPVHARYVKLTIIKPTQGSDSATRIYEVEVHGINETLK